MFCSVQAVPSTFNTTVDTCQYCRNDVIINAVSMTTQMRSHLSNVLQPISSLCFLEHLNQQLISRKGLATATTSTVCTHMYVCVKQLSSLYYVHHKMSNADTNTQSAIQYTAQHTHQTTGTSSTDFFIWTVSAMTSPLMND